MGSIESTAADTNAATLEANQGSPEIVRTMVAKLFKHIYDLSGTHPEYDKTTNWVTGSGTSGPQTRDFLRRYFTTGDLINGWDGNAAFLSLQKAKLVWVGVSDASKKLLMLL